MENSWKWFIRFHEFLAWIILKFSGIPFFDGGNKDGESCEHHVLSWVDIWLWVGAIKWVDIWLWPESSPLNFTKFLVSFWNYVINCLKNFNAFVKNQVKINWLDLDLLLGGINCVDIWLFEVIWLKSSWLKLKAIF